MFDSVRRKLWKEKKVYLLYIYFLFRNRDEKGKKKREKGKERGGK